MISFAKLKRSAIVSKVEAVPRKLSVGLRRQDDRDSRILNGLREKLSGDPRMYDITAHSQFVGCVVDIEATVQAKEAMREALHETPWTQEQLADAVRHEVNRMGYRLLTEIEERLLYQLRDVESLAGAAREQNLSQQVAERLAKLATGTAILVSERRETDFPNEATILETSNLYLMWTAVQDAINQRDEAAIWAEITGNPANDPIFTLEPDVQAAIENALKITEKWEYEDIQNGAEDYHVTNADLVFKDSAADRNEWILTRPTDEERQERSGDCLTRTLNELQGGGAYGKTHDDVTERLRERGLGEDADQGAPDSVSTEMLRKRGLQPLLEAYTDTSHPMRKHIDIREIATLLGSLFPDEEKPLEVAVFIENHVAAILDGALHDDEDWTRWGDSPATRERAAVTGIWIRCDDEDVVSQARDILAKYEAVRRLDEAMTRGVLRRQTIQTRSNDDEYTP